MLMSMDAASTRAILSRAPGLNAGHVRALSAAGDSQDLLNPATLREAELPSAVRAYLISPDEAALAADLEWIGSSGARLILCTDPDYPPQLASVAGAPPLLFVLGDSGALATRQIAMVGSRNPTSGGRANARAFAADFATAGITVTSGLASGVDAAGHEGALEAGGLTVAVCGTGLDQVYPTQHAALAGRIRERGALVSEYPPRTPPKRSNFPRRNRLISGLSAGTLVVEAAVDSGSLITARFATSQGRPVFAIPGSIHNPLAQGCHALIRAGALLVSSAAEVLSEFKFSLVTEALALAPAPVGKRRPLDNEYEMLLDALEFEPATIESITARTGIPGEAVASMLLILELEGRVAPHPGGWYGRTP
jgi:DNA processing protein